MKKTLDIARCICVAVSLGSATIASLSGCAIAAVIGGAAESYHYNSSSEHPADYEGLSAHSFAVYVTADRVIQADHPELIARVAGVVNQALAENAGATGYIPTQTMLNAQFNNPQWNLLPRGELAEVLEVDRLVSVEVMEYRLTEAGNRYVWDGLADAHVEVYEADSSFPDEPSYDKFVTVRFPDLSGVLREEVPENVVNSELARRLTDRVKWLFYTHDEPNSIKY
ncbi:MAG: hypothetical protein AAGI53_11460 [Planctomycetota bacterium]